VTVKVGQPQAVSALGLLNILISFQSAWNVVVDPFAYAPPPTPAAAGIAVGSFTPPQLAYQERTVLNAGFTVPGDDDLIEMKSRQGVIIGRCPGHCRFCSGIGLKAGRRAMARCERSRGACHRGKSSRSRSRGTGANDALAGRKRPAGGWDKGNYKATYIVERDGQVVLKRSWKPRFSCRAYGLSRRTNVRAHDPALSRQPERPREMTSAGSRHRPAQACT